MGEDAKPVYMIDADSNFCKENVDRIIKRSAELSAPNSPYAVVSIVGAQSSGKSYLMNCLFRTEFPVMNAKLGRSQTSRGIMMSSYIHTSFILLDVEGFDGREKGEDTLFEKRAALFALVVSDIIMVNISITDIGREQGGATPLFRTIFQERKKLPPAITKLLVVIRLYDGETPLEVLRSNVLESLEKIWQSVNIESVKFKDYIEVNIFPLRDKNSLEFQQEVTGLRDLLSNNNSAKNLASGFSLSSREFWDTIKENKDLDIPSHQVAVARLFCRELVEDILNSLNSRELLKAEEYSQGCFKEISRELLKEINIEYDLKTKRYDPDVRDKERQCLVQRLNTDYFDRVEERKAHAKKKKLGLMSVAGMVATAGGVGVSMVTGVDLVTPISIGKCIVKHLVSATQDNDSDLPSASDDEDCDLSFD